MKKWWWRSPGHPANYMHTPWSICSGHIKVYDDRRDMKSVIAVKLHSLLSLKLQRHQRAEQQSGQQQRWHAAHLRVDCGHFCTYAPKSYDYLTKCVAAAAADGQL